MLYITLAIVVVVAAAVAIVLIAFPPSSYSLKVGLSAANTSNLYPYQTSRFVINVNNTGSAQVSNLILGLYSNGTELQHYTITVPAHQGLTLRYNYTYTTAGTYDFHAIADPGSLINIANRSNAQGSVLVKVISPEIPNVYKTIPNNNIIKTQSFTMSGTGMYSTEAIAQTYELTLVNNMFGNSKGVMTKLFGNLYGYVAGAYGAYVGYSNSTSAYSLWMQGTLDPRFVDYVLSTFRLPQSNVTVNGTKISIARMDNRTSLCTYYSNGWTKLLTYYNNSLNTTCLSMMSKSFAPNESSVLVVALNNSKELTHYQSGFLYNGSQGVGSSLFYSNQSVGVANLFQNNYGLFISYLQRLNHAANATTLSCAGLVFDRNGTHLCSYILPPSNRENATGFGMVNTTEFAGNYAITLYSLVNDTQFLAAHQNAASLIYALSINQTGASWTQAMKNTCLLNSTGISCSVNSFDIYNSIANVTLTNGLSAPISISDIACRMPSIKIDYPANFVIGSNSNMSLSFPCYNIAAPVHASVTSYTLAINYTYNNAKDTVSGLLNVTTAGFS